MEREYTLKEAVDFAMLNEADTLVEQGKKVDDYSTAQLAFDNAVFYAEQYGYTPDEFREELQKRGAR